MKTFIINGSTNPRGDTAALLDAYLSAYDGEVRVISRKNRITPCLDCRRCKSLAGCAIEDEMTAALGYIAECDCVVIASPVWFGSLSGTTLDIASRLQTLFAARRFRGETPAAKPKRGVLLLARGGSGGDEGAVRAAKMIFSCVGVDPARISIVRSESTDITPAQLDAAALAAARAAAAAK